MKLPCAYACRLFDGSNTVEACKRRKGCFTVHKCRRFTRQPNNDAAINFKANLDVVYQLTFIICEVNLRLINPRGSEIVLLIMFKPASRFSNSHAATVNQRALHLALITFGRNPKAHIITRVRGARRKRPTFRPGFLRRIPSAATRFPPVSLIDRRIATGRLDVKVIARRERLVK